MRINVLRTMAAAFLAAAAVPAAADAQTLRSHRGPDGPRMEAPAERIIEHRDELGLTEAQVVQLRGIQAQLEEQNQPLIEQVRERMRAQMQERGAAGDSAQRRQFRRPGGQMTPETRAVMEQLRANRRNALEQIQATLTPEQKEKLREVGAAARRQHEPGARRAPGMQRERRQSAVRGAR